MFYNGDRITLKSISDTATVRAFKDAVREVAAIPADRKIHLVVNRFELRDEERTLDDYGLMRRLENMGDDAYVQVHVFPPFIPKRTPSANRAFSSPFPNVGDSRGRARNS